MAKSAMLASTKNPIWSARRRVSELMVTASAICAGVALVDSKRSFNRSLLRKLMLNFLQVYAKLRAEAMVNVQTLFFLSLIAC